MDLMPADFTWLSIMGDVSVMVNTSVFSTALVFLVSVRLAPRLFRLFRRVS